MAISDQEREDAMTIGKLSAENSQNKSNIDTLFAKLDALTAEMHKFKTDVMVEVAGVSTKLSMMIGAAAIISPMIFAFMNYYLHK